MDAHTTQTIQKIPLDLIDEPPQVREHFDTESLMALAASIRAHEIQHPVVLRRVGARYAVVVGGRRVRGAGMASLSEIPAVVFERDLTETETLELQLLENLAREDLNPVEKARGFSKWISLTGGTAAELGRKVGVSPAVVSKLSAMLLLVPDVLDLVAHNKLPYSAGCELAKLPPEDQRRLASQVANGGLTRDALVTLLHNERAGKGRTASRKPRRVRRERIVIPLGQGRSVAISAPTMSVESVATWLMELVDRIRAAGADGCSLGDVVKALSVGRK